ncbi:MAG: chemotaxis protein CheC [candidate division NC10 bacterium]|nr:chemotaxis protein CheC [candidate division NC10 bacterium]
MTDHGAVSDVILRQLQDLSTQSMHRASESLGALLGHPVRLTVSDIRALPKSALPGLVEGSGAVLMAGLGFQVVGEVRGPPGSPRSLSGEEQSALQEVGNIVASSFLSGLGDLLGKRLMPTPPEFHFDDFPSLMRQVTATLEGQGEEVLVVQALFEDPEQHIEGRFFVLPEVDSLAAMFQRAAGDRRAET